MPDLAEASPFWLWETGFAPHIQLERAWAATVLTDLVDLIEVPLVIALDGGWVREGVSC